MRSISTPVLAGSRRHGIVWSMFAGPAAGGSGFAEGLVDRLFCEWQGLQGSGIVISIPVAALI
jgi:hypothetical protein